VTLFSHDALPCLQTLVKYLQWWKRQKKVTENRNKEGVSYFDKQREGEREGDRGSNSFMDEMEVVVTMGRWREIEGDCEVVGLCFCSLTAWQSSLD